MGSSIESIFSKAGYQYKKIDKEHTTDSQGLNAAQEKEAVSLYDNNQDVKEINKQLKDKTLDDTTKKSLNDHLSLLAIGSIQFAKLDTNHDKKLSQNEVDTAYNRGDKDALRNAMQLNNGTKWSALLSPDEMTNVLDADRSGSLEQREIDNLPRDSDGNFTPEALKIIRKMANPKENEAVTDDQWNNLFTPAPEGSAERVLQNDLKAALSPPVNQNRPSDGGSQSTGTPPVSATPEVPPRTYTDKSGYNPGDTPASTSGDHAIKFGDTALGKASSDQYVGKATVAGAGKMKKEIANAVHEFYQAHKQEMEEAGLTEQDAKEMLIAMAGLEAKFGTSKIDSDKGGTDCACFGIFNINQGTARTVGINDPAKTLGTDGKTASEPTAVAASVKAALEKILDNKKNGKNQKIKDDPVGAFLAEHRAGSTGLKEFSTDGCASKDTYGVKDYLKGMRAMMKAYDADPKSMTDDTNYWTEIPHV